MYNDIVFFCLGMIIEVSINIIFIIKNVKDNKKFKGYIDILSNFTPEQIQEIENNIDQLGKGDFKLDYVLTGIKSICSDNKIKFDENIFKKAINKFVELLNYGRK